MIGAQCTQTLRQNKDKMVQAGEKRRKCQRRTHTQGGQPAVKKCIPVTLRNCDEDIRDVRQS